MKISSCNIFVIKLIELKGEVELGAIYLFPEYQGKGIGTFLLQEEINSLEGS